jgi:hypothetical protein
MPGRAMGAAGVEGGVDLVQWSTTIVIGHLVLRVCGRDGGTPGKPAVLAPEFANLSSFDAKGVYRIWPPAPYTIQFPPPRAESGNSWRNATRDPRPACAGPRDVVDEGTDAVHPGVSGPAVYAAAVVADLDPRSVRVDCRHQVQIVGAGHAYEQVRRFFDGISKHRLAAGYILLAITGMRREPSIGQSSARSPQDQAARSQTYQCHRGPRRGRPDQDHVGTTRPRDNCIYAGRLHAIDDSARTRCCIDHRPGGVRRTKDRLTRIATPAA